VIYNYEGNPLLKTAGESWTANSGLCHHVCGWQIFKTFWSITFMLYTCCQAAILFCILQLVYFT